MDEADPRLAGVEVEADDEGQPFAFGDSAAMHAFDFDDRADATGLLDGDVPDCARELFASGSGFRVSGRAVLEDADELGCSGDGFAADADGVENLCAAERDGVLETVIDEDGFAVVLDSDGRVGEAWALQLCQVHRESCGTAESGGNDGGESIPFDGAVGPVSERPALQQEALVSGSELEKSVALNRALRKGHAKTDPGDCGGRLFAEP